MKKITMLLFLGCMFAGFANTNTTARFLECPAPFEIVAGEITNNSVTITWTAGATETDWEIIISEVGLPAPTTNSTGVPVEDTPLYTTAILESGKHYNVYIRANCGSEFSSWSPAIYFSTTCDAIGVFNETFETTAAQTLPLCWSKILAGPSLSPSAAVRTSASNSYEGTKAMQLFTHSTEQDSDIILVSPNLNTLSTGSHRLKLYAKSSTATGSLEIGTVDSATQEFTFFEGIDLSNVYTEYTIDFAAYEGTDTYIGFRQASPAFTTLYLDNIRWEATPPCADVSNIIIDDTTTSSVTLSWTANGEESEWDIVYGDLTVTDPTTLTPVTPAATTNDGAVVNGLLPNSSYKLWIRSACDGDANGYWMGPITFHTPCIPTTAINENFDTTAVNALPNCWSALLAGETLSPSSFVSVYGSNAVSGTNCVRMNNTNSGDDAKIMLVSPNLSNLSAATHRLRFSASGNGGATILDIGTLSNNSQDAVFTSIMPISLPGQYAEYIVDFSDYSGTDQYIALRNASETGYKLIFIDDIVWEAIPNCADVTSITVTDATISTVTVNWLAGNSEINWQIAHAPVAVTDPAMATISEIWSETNYSIEGLSAATTYNVWVRSVCGDENGNWMGPIAFNTACNAMTTFNENFDSVSYPSLPVCWSKLLTGATEGSAIAVSPFSATSAPNSALLFGEYSGEGANVILISPELSTLSAGDYQLTFDATGSHPLEIGTLNNNTSEAVFTAFSTVTLSDFASESFTVDFATYTGTDTYIGFRLQTNGQNAYASIDDAVWEQSLSTGGSTKAAFSYYPNPVKDVLHLSYSEAITAVCVYNLLGQKVMEIEANSPSVKMDLSALASGSYIVKVAADDQSRSIKVIKQ